MNVIYNRGSVFDNSEKAASKRETHKDMPYRKAINNSNLYRTKYVHDSIVRITTVIFLVVIGMQLCIYPYASGWFPIR